MNLSRTRNGTMIHNRVCRFANNGTPWLWADERSLNDVIRVCEYFGYETCVACKPLGRTVLKNLPKRFKK